MLFVLQLLQLAAKRLMMHLAIQQLGKHDRVPPPWLLLAVTWEWKSAVTLTRGSWTPRRPACRSANRSIRSETQYGRIGRAGGTARGALLASRSTFHVSLSQKPCGARKHGALIKHAGLSEIIQHFDFYCLQLDLWFSVTDWFMFLWKKQRETLRWNMVFYVSWMRPSK